MACVRTVCVLGLLSSVVGLTPGASAQPPSSMPNAVPPTRQSEFGAPQVYPNNRGWSPPAQAVQIPHWPPDRIAQLPGRVNSPSPAQPSTANRPQTNVFAPAQTVAWVGDQQIFRGELLGEANLIMAPALEKMQPDEIEREREAIERQREQILQKLLPGVIDRKLMYLEFLRTAPADKLEEMLENIQNRIAEVLEKALFDMLEKLHRTKPEQYQALARQDNQLFRLALAMKEHNMSSLGQLDGYLKHYGSSLEKQKESFAERSLGQQKIRDSVNFKPDVTHQEMLDYYRDENKEFEVPAQSRWQQLTIRFDRAGGKDAAGDVIAELGNEMALGGKPFWAVAQERSHGPQAKEGGVHDWTEWGDLEVSREINEAVFALPIGELSPIIIDAEGLHIVKVLDRHDAHVVPFRDAQVDIKAKIQSRKRNKAFAGYVERLRQETPFRTIYDDQTNQRLAEPPRGRSSAFPR